MAKVKKGKIPRVGKNVGEGTLLFADGLCEVVHHFRNGLTAPARADGGLPCGLQIPLLVMCPTKCLTFSHQKSSRRILGEALFITVPNWK